MSCTKKQKHVFIKAMKEEGDVANDGLGMYTLLNDNTEYEQVYGTTHLTSMLTQYIGKVTL